ncbi:NACHT, LRR and PYD domains-containing protein 1b allele 3-like isoform X3 [Bufo bufo]|uniref:NACHT, LRR and PYD domains-containing protein 1b allele 3-like isoform X3 n=1 Tax=Bufo bufo TaxID=8384 RepID=UPI001ABE46A8|nr:NACHT, LRR and PYD domains-containing protein 1b allele 3-like isoform X3 [Bufo bufo]
MKETYRDKVTKISSTTNITEHKMASGPSEKVKDSSALATQISSNKYRVEVESMFHCQETGIKFKVETKTIIEYSLEYGNDYINLIQENGCELLGPIFNVDIKSVRVSAVYLPHYVCLEGFKDTSMIKFGHFKDGKVTLQIPTKIEPSYVVQNDPKFSCVAAVGEHSTSIWRRKKTFPFNGQVLLYSRVVGDDEYMEYRIHLYLVPTDRPHLKKLNEQMRHDGYKRINKPSLIRKVYTNKDYSITGKPNPKICPKTLQFTVHTEIEHCEFTEMNFAKSTEEILLHVKAESSSPETVWSGELTRGDPPKNFVEIYRSQLVQKVKNIMPVLDDLRTQELLSGEDYDTVTRQSTKQDMMRNLLDFAQSWGSEDMDTFYDVLKSHNKQTIKYIEEEN